MCHLLFYLFITLLLLGSDSVRRVTSSKKIEIRGVLGISPPLAIEMLATYSGSPQVDEWWHSKDRFIQERCRIMYETTEECIRFWRGAIDSGYEILKADFERKVFCPTFIYMYIQFFYTYTSEWITTSMKQYTDNYDVMHELLKNYEKVLAEHRRENGLPERVCRECRDYYCDTRCYDPGDRRREPRGY